MIIESGIRKKLIFENKIAESKKAKNDIPYFNKPKTKKFIE